MAATIWFWERVFSKGNYEPAWPQHPGLDEAIVRIQER